MNATEPVGKLLPKFKKKKKMKKYKPGAAKPGALKPGALKPGIANSGAAKPTIIVYRKVREIGRQLKRDK